MDQLDTWLNAQHGRRLFALLCLSMYPGAVMLGGAITELSSGFPGPSARSVFLSAALSIPGAVPLAGLTLLLRPWQVRRFRRRGKPAPPLLSWRRSLFGMLLAAGITVSMVEDAESYRWMHAHHELFLTGYVLLVAAILVSLWEWRYQRRITMRS